MFLDQVMTTRKHSWSLDSPFRRILRQPITDHRRRRQTRLSDMSSLWVQVSSSSLPCRALQSCTASVSRPTLQRQSVDLPKAVSKHEATELMIDQVLFLCSQFIVQKEKCSPFLELTPTRFDKCHETSQIFPRTEQTVASARSFGVIS